MPWSAALRRAVRVSRAIVTLSVEVGMAGMIFVTRRDQSKRLFRQALGEQDLPAEVVEQLSQTYDAGQIHFRELVRSRGSWRFEH